MGSFQGCGTVGTACKYKMYLDAYKHIHVKYLSTSIFFSYESVYSDQNRQENEKDWGKEQ